MRIKFSQTGGLAYLPGLNKPVTIEVDHLDKGEAEELKRLVQDARFFDLPAAIGAPARGAADYQQYILTVEDGGRSIRSASSCRSGTCLSKSLSGRCRSTSRLLGRQTVPRLPLQRLVSRVRKERAHG